MNRLIILLAALLTLSSCFESTAYDTTCIVEPYTQTASGDDYVSLAGAKCFAMAGNTDEWTIDSYSEALEGVFTSVLSGEKVSATAVGEPYAGSETQISIYLDQEEMVIVVVDPSSEIYAYRDYEVPHNFYELNITLTFLPWKVSDYTASKWSFVVPPFDILTYILSTEMLPTEESEAESLVGAKCHIFEIDDNDWFVASYEDALEGKLTAYLDPYSPDTSTGTHPLEDSDIHLSLPNRSDKLIAQDNIITLAPSIDFEPYEGSESQFVASLTSGSVMFVVADPTTESYAFKEYTVTEKVRTDAGSVQFCPWKEAVTYTWEGWSFVTKYVEPEIDADEEDDTTQE